MGQHRASADRGAGGGVGASGSRRAARGRRGVSRWVIFAALSVLLVVAVVVVWQRLGDHLDRQADDAAAACVEGTAVVPVVADPDVAPGLTAIAAAYGKTKPVVRDRCITVTVRAADARIVLEGLRGRWDTAAMGAYPAAWVPQSSVWSAQLMTDRPDAVDGRPESLVTSPVVLAASPEFADAADSLDWAQLPALQRGDEGLTDLGLRGWGSLRMAMPNGPGSDASALAAQAVAARVLRVSGPLTDDGARSARARSSITALTRPAPRSPDGTPAGAVRVIAEASDAADAPIHVVPITEQKLYQLTRPDAESPVSGTQIRAVRPTGATPQADFPVVRLAGDEVSVAASAALAEFLRFAAQPDQVRALTSLGFRGAAPMPPPTTTVDFPTVADPMPAPENRAIVTINRLVYGRAIG
ncbi:hypothetical protein GCM10009624_05700 [Gordonia sinesedis]